MKLLTPSQQSQISGGAIITLDGSKYYVNTVGIPQSCVTLFEGAFNAGFTEANKPNSSHDSIMNAIDTHLDPIINSGCVMYFDQFLGELNYSLNIS